MIVTLFAAAILLALVVGFIAGRAWLALAISREVEARRV